MRELSLFTGAGGGLLGSKFLGFKHRGYVEYDDYCQQSIAQRIKDGHLDNAPIFGDIDTFISDGYANAYSGLVDIVTAGFPCQPFSVAGKRQGGADHRNKWPQTLDVVRRVRPHYAFLENVPGLLTTKCGYIRRIFGDLAETGYDAVWTVVSAADVGAPHLRKRLWVLCKLPDYHASVLRLPSQSPRRQATSEPEHHGEKEPLAHAVRQGRPVRVPDLSDSESQSQGISSRGEASGGDNPQDPDRSTWPPEPDVGRVADGVASRVDRLKAIGNGQVPSVAATAFRLLYKELNP